MTHERMYVVVVTGLEVRCGDPGKTLMTPAGERFLVIKGQDGWVEATSTPFKGKIPAYAKTFVTVEEAKSFAKRWMGHPWWCIPSGEYEILPVRPRYRQVLDGYDVDGSSLHAKR